LHKQIIQQVFFFFFWRFISQELLKAESTVKMGLLSHIHTHINRSQNYVQFKQCYMQTAQSTYGSLGLLAYWKKNEKSYAQCSTHTLCYLLWASWHLNKASSVYIQTSL